MKQFLQTLCVLTLIASFAFGGPRPRAKSEIRTDIMKRVEPDYRRGPGAGRANCAHATPRVPCETNDDCSDVNGDVGICDTFVGSCLCLEADGCYGEVDEGEYMKYSKTFTTVIDSSSNGYGMVATVTRPMDVNSDGNMLTIYRQYAGENTTHGQLGAGYGVVTGGEIQWDAQFNVNYNGNPPWGGGGVGGCGCAQARYPSGIASEEYPYAIWNEYTAGPPTCPAWPGGCSLYGGRPYFSYDEFGWGGESWIYPAELDPLYDCSKDLWSGSVGYGYNAGSGEHHVSAVYDDWTRDGHYLFTSEAVVEGYIVLGTETLIINPDHLGTVNYSSRSILSINDNGQGLLGLDGIFAGNDMDAGTCGPPASNLTCNKTPMFKLTNDYGVTWQGNHAAFDLHFVPDEVFDDIFESWPSSVVSDPCTGAIENLIGFWSWYEFDMRVDNEGNPHIVISLIGETATDFPTIDGKTGFYHLTIDRDNLSSPGPVNECIAEDDTVIDGCIATGWTWSYIPLPANDSFDWARPDGYSYLYGAMCQISLSRDNPDIVYMVANIAEEGKMSSEYDANGDGVEDNPCVIQDWPWELYPNWSEDIWVAKSEDNGSTWTALDNLTNTPRNPGNPLVQNCAPEEQYVHTAHWSDDERVYFQYDQPNWEWNEIGDALGADCMNYVWLGYSNVEATGVGGCTDNTVCNYDPLAAFDDGSCANVIGTETCDGSGDGAVGTSGCDCAGNCFTYIDQPMQVLGCDGVCGSGMVYVCNTDTGGIGDCVASSEVCYETQASYCENYPDNPDCMDNCNQAGLPADGGEVNSWNDCEGVVCGTSDPLFGCEGHITCDGGRCYTCSNSQYTEQEDCVGAGYIWEVELDPFSDDDEDLVTDEASCTGVWIEFADESWDGSAVTEEVELGDPDECYCDAATAEFSCEASCPAEMGDISGDGLWNILDLVQLAACVLHNSCIEHPNVCAADINGDGNYNVLDIVHLANCVLAGNCGGRVDDATKSKIIMKDNVVSIEADGFIGGVQMTLKHGDDFSIEMTDSRLYADYLTVGNQTRLLVINPETDELFKYTGNFEIVENIVANSYAEISASLPLISDFSLSEAYPNPFNPSTSIKLYMPKEGNVNVQVYELSGREVATLLSGIQAKGEYKLTWNASNQASGMYLIRAEAAGTIAMQKILLLK